MHGIDKVSQICSPYIKLSTHISMINYEKNKGVFRHRCTAYFLGWQRLYLGVSDSFVGLIFRIPDILPES